MNAVPCHNRDPELWFPLSEKMTRQIAEAAALCAVCPIRQQCLDYAIEQGEREGIWGGLTLTERIRYAMERPIKPKGERDESRRALNRELASR